MSKLWSSASPPPQRTSSDLLPPKLYYRIGEVAGLVGVEPHVLRYWEREFRSIRPTKSAKGQRVYSRKDVENLMRVRSLLYEEGFTIAGAKKKMLGGGPLPSMERLLKAPLTEPSPRADLPRPDQAAPPAAEPPRASAPEVPRPSPTAPPRGRSVQSSPELRTTLLELRSEIEALLQDLGG